LLLRIRQRKPTFYSHPPRRTVGAILHDVGLMAGTSHHKAETRQRSIPIDRAIARARRRLSLFNEGLCELDLWHVASPRLLLSCGKHPVSRGEYTWRNTARQADMKIYRILGLLLGGKGPAKSSEARRLVEHPLGKGEVVSSIL